MFYVRNYPCHFSFFKFISPVNLVDNIPVVYSRIIYKKVERLGKLWKKLGEIKMEIQELTLHEILKILKETPEQRLFDWKRNLSLESDDKKGELIKDIAAVANGTKSSPGYIFYGVDPRLPEPVVGMSSSYDDASFQQLVSRKVDPMVEFLYYEVSNEGKNIGVIHIPPSQRRPHFIKQDFGKLSEGQLVIRQGSSTRGMNGEDLLETFYGDTSPYFQNVLKKVGAEAMQKQAEVAQQRENRSQLELMRDLAREIMPPGAI